MVVLAGEDRQQHRGVTLKVFKLWREREISGGEKKKNNLGYLKRESDKWAGIQIILLLNYYDNSAAKYRYNLKLSTKLLK